MGGKHIIQKIQCLDSKITLSHLRSNCVLQFSAHKVLYVVVNVGQINMTKIIIMKHFNWIKYMIFLMV